MPPVRHFCKDDLNLENFRSAGFVGSVFIGLCATKFLPWTCVHKANAFGRSVRRKAVGSRESVLDGTISAMLTRANHATNGNNLRFCNFPARVMDMSSSFSQKNGTQICCCCPSCSQVSTGVGRLVI